MRQSLTWQQHMKLLENWFTYWLVEYFICIASLFFFSWAVYWFSMFYYALWFLSSISAHLVFPFLFFFKISALPFNTFLFFLINSCLLQKISLWLSEEEQQIHVREKICLYCRHPGIRLLCLMTLSGLLIATKIYITLLSPDLRTPFLFQPRLTLVEEMSWARTYKQTANSNRWSRTILFCGCWQMIQLLYIM